ncbi:hypothetical protein FKM82_016026 [Ascaphus truei]
MTMARAHLLDLGLLGVPPVDLQSLLLLGDKGGLSYTSGNPNPRCAESPRRGAGFSTSRAGTCRVISSVPPEHAVPPQGNTWPAPPAPRGGYKALPCADLRYLLKGQELSNGPARGTR